MDQKQPFYVVKLKESLSLRQRVNPSYSLRAFARDLNIHGATLSQIINGKRALPMKRAADIARSLKLSPKDKTLFMESFLRLKTSIDLIKIDNLDQRFILDESCFDVIAEWEHYTVLELFNLAEYDLSPQGIARKLDIEVSRAEVVLKNLQLAGLITKNSDGEFSRTHSGIKTTEDTASDALKESHIQTLEMGIKSINKVDIDLRDYSSTTVAVDLNKIPEVKAIIREFRQKISALLKSGNKKEVYQLAVQFYPLTNAEKVNQNV